VQSPFSPLKYLDIERPYFGDFLPQKMHFRQVKANDGLLEKVRQDMIMEYAGNAVLEEDRNLGFLLRGQYRGRGENRNPSCDRCFANMEPNSYLCRFLLEGTKALWD
jgi:hypothetical protein